MSAKEGAGFTKAWMDWLVGWEEIQKKAWS